MGSPVGREWGGEERDSLPQHTFLPLGGVHTAVDGIFSLRSTCNISTYLVSMQVN